MKLLDAKNNPIEIGQKVKFCARHNRSLIDGAGEIVAIDPRSHAVTIATGIQRHHYGRGGYLVAVDDKITVGASYERTWTGEAVMKLCRDTEFHQKPIYVEVI